MSRRRRSFYSGPCLVQRDMERGRQRAGVQGGEGLGGIQIMHPPSEQWDRHTVLTAPKPLQAPRSGSLAPLPQAQIT